MITKKTIEDYAAIQGGRCLEMFAMKEDFLSKEPKKKIVERLLDVRVELLAKDSKNLPIIKENRINYLLENYDLEVLILKWRQLLNKRAKEPGFVFLSWIFGDLPKKIISKIMKVDMKNSDEKEQKQVALGFVLVALWDKAK